MQEAAAQGLDRLRIGLVALGGERRLEIGDERPPKALVGPSPLDDVVEAA